MKPAIICFALACLSVTAIAQQRWSVEFAGGWTYLSEEHQTLDGWNNGWTAAAGVAYELTPSYTLVARQSYSDLVFTGLSHFSIPAPPVEPRLVVVGDKTDPTVGYHVQGKSSTLYRTSFGIQTTSTRNAVRPFLSLESGFVVFHVGRITYQIPAYPPGPNVAATPGTEKVYRDPTTLLRGFSAIGAGLSVPLHTDLGVKFEAQWFDTWNNSDAYFPLTATVSLQL